MAIDDDLPEYTGSDRTTLASPKSKPAPIGTTYTERTALTATSGLEPDAPHSAEEHPAPRVTPYSPPAPGASHPRHAILGPALRLDKAEHVLTMVSLELRRARDHLRQCELAEAAAEVALVSAIPGPTPDELLRQHAANELKIRADRIAAGLSPDPKPAAQHGNSVLDRNAANRARPAPGTASSLQSHAIRRTF